MHTTTKDTVSGNINNLLKPRSKQNPEKFLFCYWLNERITLFRNMCQSNTYPKVTKASLPETTANFPVITAVLNYNVDAHMYISIQNG